MRWRMAAPEHLEAAVYEPLTVHARADADFVQEVDAHLLEHAGADAGEHVRAALAFDDHRVDPGLRQQLPEQQAGRARADDRDLCSRDLCPARPASAWSRRLHALAALRVHRRRRRHEREQRAGVFRLPRARADPGREGGDDLELRWQRPEHVDARDVNQLGELLKAEGDVAARDERADGNARRRRDDPIPDLLGDAPALEQLRERDAARAGRRIRSWTPPPPRAGGRPRCRSRAGARRPAPRPPRPSARGRPCCRRRGGSEASSLSMASDASTTTSNGSPACTRRAASTPPTDSITITCLERAS